LRLNLNNQTNTPGMLFTVHPIRHFHFGTHDGTTWSEKVTFLNSGNVGIGTTNPGATLDLVNTANAWATRGIRLLGPNMNAGGALMVSVGKADSAYNMGQMYFYQAGDGSTSNRLSFGLHSVDDVLNILGTGNVGIGMTNPGSYKLLTNY